ncbi:MAG: stage 0 sporulation protein [Bacilli bacterium]|nr:stage 0 sporulation protein [Bacilli bacterium]MBQ6538651.1 stage 0 sporulation protein [Bacilli bacterium]
MIDVVVVSCKLNNGVYYVSPNDVDVSRNDQVIFEDGEDYLVGTVIKNKYPEKKKNLFLPLPNIVRKVNKEDLKTIEKNEELAKKALVDAKKEAKNLDLEMNFVDCYFNLNKSQLIFSFLSDNRIDFRTLAKKLAAKYKTRIELRQIGIRDKARKVGGVGPCGLFLCCNRFLTDLNSVSINMAKNQNLALNPSKINGLCGRLYCCLGYENDLYSELKKDLPAVGSEVKTDSGKGKVISVDVLNRSYKVDLGEREIVQVFCDKNGKNK